jgi:ABC-2 type transport system permease protein
VDYFQSLVPGVVIMSIFLGAMTTGVFNIVMDRFLGVEEAYLLTPLTKTDIVAGLIISGLSITTTVAVIVLAASIALTGIPLPDSPRQYALALLVIVLTTLSLLSLMFTVLGRAKHPRIVGILSGFLNVILFFPSGAIYPIASLPGWLRGLARINPEAYAVDALKSVLFKNAGFMTVIADVVFLGAFAAVMMTVSIVLFRRTL